MSSFHISIEDPKEIIPRLGKQQRDWKVGRSALELSTLWMRAKGLPASVKATLDQAVEWRGAKLLEGIFERQTPMPGRGRPSQTDLLAIVALQDGNAILGVEGKVDEPFGSLVQEWLAGRKDQTQDDDTEEASNTNRKARLAGLCETLNVDATTVGKLYYQLFHRTCASIYEAKRFGYKRAVVLVHSFAPVSSLPESPAGFREFSDFADALGMPVAAPGSISPAKYLNDIDLRLAWVSDKPST